MYCGAGRAVVRDTGEKIDGSPLVAFKSARGGKVPFSEIHLADASKESCNAAAQRILEAGGTTQIEVGEAAETAVRIVQKLNPHGLHFVFLDPFNLQDLPFSVIETFAELKRIDVLIHVSAQDLQRNLHSYTKAGDLRLERFAPGWREVVDLQQTQQGVRAALLAHWTSKIDRLGLPPAEHAELISGSSKNQRLYWLVFASRHPLAKQFWDEIRSVSGQGDLF